MNLENSHYDAFISYRHSEIDKFVAENIHRELEKLKFPKKLIKEGKGNGKKRITRVFRDQEELPLTSDLAEPINNALRNSEYLIVICSPRLPESIWCRREVETFIELHGREKVFAVLVEGRAHESFPDSILWAEQVVRDQNGFIRIERNPVEPLAADVRGKDKKEIKKKIKSEVLRLAAPMFDVSFDDLKQRHREQRTRRLLTFSAITSSIFLTFGMISTAMALYIRQQSQQIQTQSQELQIQYDEAMVNQANLVATESQELVSYGRRKEAVSNLLAVMPSSMEDTEQIPYTASTENALGQALYTYEQGCHQTAASTLEMDYEAQYVEVSPEGDRIISVDDNKNLYIWDSNSGECLQKIPGDSEEDESLGSFDDEAVFTDNSHIIYEGKNGFVLYNLDTKQIDVSYEIPGNSFSMYKEAFCPETDMVIFDDLSYYYVYRISTGEMLARLDIMEEQSTSGEFCFTEDGTRLVYTTEARSITDPCTVVTVMDTDSWETLGQYRLSYPRIWDVEVFHDQIILIVNGDEKDVPLYIPNYYFVALNMEDGSTSWKRKCDWGIPSSIHGNHSWENNMIAIDCSGTVVTLNSQTGEINGVMSSGKTMKVCEPSDVVEGAFLLISENGEVYDYLSDLQSYRTSIRILMNDSTIKQLSKSDMVMATIGYDSAEITVYQYVKGENAKRVQQFEHTIAGMVCNIAGDRAIISICGDNEYLYYLYDLEQDTIVKEIEMEDETQLAQMFFTSTQEDTFGLIGKKVHYFSARDGAELDQKVEILDEEGQTIDSLFLDYHTDTEKKTLSFVYNNNLYIFDSSDMKLLYCTARDMETPPDDIYRNSIFDVSDNMKYLAYHSENRKQIEIYKLEDSSLYSTIPVNSSYLRYIFFDETSEQLYASYKDGELCIYDLKDGSLLKSIELDTCVGSVKPVLEDGNRILSGGKMYILDQNYEVKATICNALNFNIKQNAVYTCWYQNMSKIPIYSYDELLKEARDFVK